MSDPTSPDGVAKLADAARAAREHQEAAQRLSPIDDSGVEEATSLLDDSARELRTCINMTQTVMRTLDEGRVQQRAGRADEHCSRSDSLLKESVTNAEDTFNVLGGSAAMPGLGDEVQDLALGRN